MPYSSAVKKDCEVCGQPFYTVHPLKKRCGRAADKSGCDYLFVLEQARLSHRKRYPEHAKRWYLAKKAKRTTEYWKKQYQWKKTNRWERELELSREHYRRHKEYYSRYAKKWRQNNRERSRQLCSNRRVRLLGALGSHTVEQWLAICKLFGDACVGCGKKERLTIDHKIPLTEGGANSADNLQPLCNSCNARKQTKTMFAASRIADRSIHLVLYAFGVADQERLE